MLRKLKSHPSFYLSLLGCYASGLIYIASSFNVIPSFFVWPATLSAVFFALLVLRKQPTQPETIA